MIWLDPMIDLIDDCFTSWTTGKVSLWVWWAEDCIPDFWRWCYPIGMSLWLFCGHGSQQTKGLSYQGGSKYFPTHLWSFDYEWGDSGVRLAKKLEQKKWYCIFFTVPSWQNVDWAKKQSSWSFIRSWLLPSPTGMTSWPKGLWIQAAKILFLRRVAGFSCRVRVRF